MKSMTKTLNAFQVLLVITVIMVLLMLLTIYRAADDSDDFAPLFPELLAQLNEVDRLQFNSREGAFSLVKDGTVWRLQDYHDYPASSRQVRRLLVDLAETQILERKTQDPAYYGLLGVEGLVDDIPQSIVIDLMAGDASLAKVMLGNQRETARWDGPIQRFVRRNDESRVWLVEGYLNLSPVMMNWIDAEIINLDRERIARVNIKQPNGQTASLVNLGQKDRFGTLRDREQTVFVYEQLGYDIAGSLHQMRLQEVQPAAGFSRGSSEVVIAEFITFEGLKVIAQTSFIDGFYYTTLSAEYDSAWATPAPADIVELNVLKTIPEVQAEAAAINEKLNPWVYRVSGFVGTNLMRAEADIVTDRGSVIPMPVDPMRMQ